MNLLFHMSYVLLLDYLIFRYWFNFANRYVVLNFAETGFLPARYIISGLVAGAFVYWAYLIPVTLLRTFAKGYWHPRWWLVWGATAAISSIQVMLIVNDYANPPVAVWPSIALVIHLQAVHFIMFMVADRAMIRGMGSILPGVRTSLVFVGMWLFWLCYSFIDNAQGNPTPLIGSALERYLLGGILLVLMVLGAGYRSGLVSQWVNADETLFAPLKIKVSDAFDGFFSAWALYYMTIPVMHYLLRGYVITHSSIFPAFLLGIVIPFVWSLLWMWVIILISKPDLWTDWRDYLLKQTEALRERFGPQNTEPS